MFFGLLDTSAAPLDPAANMSNTWQVLSMIAIWGVVIGAGYLLFYRPQKKKQKEEEALRNSVEIGDDVTTIGGIVGRIVAVRDDDETIVIETGSDRTRMRFKKWAISSVDTPQKQPKKEEKSKDEKKEEKESKKKKYDDET